MCFPLSIQGEVESARDLLRESKTASIEVVLGPDPDLFESGHFVFDVPYSLVFTLRVLSGDELVWGGVFAFDLLRKRGKRWTPIQEASRCLADFIRCDADGAFYLGGGRFIGPLSTLVKGGKDAHDRLNAYGNNFADYDANMAKKIAGEWRAVENDPLYASQRESFRQVGFHELLHFPPSEFRIYRTITYAHDRYDYRGCSNRFVVRIVSSPNSNHRFLYEYTPHTIGWRLPDEESLARGFESHLKGQLRKAGVKPCQHSGLLNLWSKRAWTELTGMTPIQHSLEAFIDEKKFLTFVLGNSKASGVASPRIEVPIEMVSDVSARNEQVIITCASGMEGQRLPCRFRLFCKDTSSARRTVEQIAGMRLRVVGRSAEILAIAAYYGNPVDSVSMVGHRALPADAIEILKSEVRNLSGGKSISFDETSRMLHIDVERRNY